MYLINESNSLYKRALLRETKVWQKNYNNTNFERIDFLPNKFFYENKEIKISGNYDWLNLVNTLGNFSNGLILGGGNTKYETYLVNKGTVKTFRNLDIIFNKGQPEKKLNSFADLNFVTLEENSYDIIIAKSILHHIINLEHLLLQVNKSLKPDGIFVVLEYIGENKQQWKEDKIIFINDILKKFGLEISRGICDNIVPFESIRSEEIPGILDQVFKGTKIIEQKWDFIYSSTKLGLYYNQSRKNIIPRNNFSTIVENIIINFESEAKEKGLLPTTLFGLYKKNMDSVEIEVKKWNKHKIKNELELNFNNQYLDDFKKLKLILRDHFGYLSSQMRIS